MCGEAQDQPFPSKTEQQPLLSHYLECVSGSCTPGEFERFYYEVNHFVLAAFLYWGFWGIFQCYNSELEFDFTQYTLARLANYEAQKARLLALQSHI